MYFERAMELVKSDLLGRLSLEMGMPSAKYFTSSHTNLVSAIITFDGGVP